MSRDKTKRKKTKDFLGYRLEIPKGMGEILSKEEEMRLLKYYRESGDINIRDRLFYANARYVPYLVKKQFQEGYLYNIEFQDAIAEGMIGLLEAIEKVNPNLQNPLRILGYATKYSIPDHLRKIGNITNITLYVPVYMFSHFHKYREAIRELEQNLGRQAGEQEIDKYLHLKFPDYKEWKRNAPQVAFLNDEDEYGVKLGDKAIKGDNRDGFFGIETKIEADKIFKVLENSSIPQKYKEMFKMRYGRGDSGRPMSLEEIADVFHTSRQTVSLHIINVIKALRKKIKTHLLLDDENCL